MPVRGLSLLVLKIRSRKRQLIFMISWLILITWSIIVLKKMSRTIKMLLMRPKERKILQICQRSDYSLMDWTTLINQIQTPGAKYQRLLESLSLRLHSQSKSSLLIANNNTIWISSSKWLLLRGMIDWTPPNKASCLSKQEPPPRKVEMEPLTCLIRANLDSRKHLWSSRRGWNSLKRSRFLSRPLLDNPKFLEFLRMFRLV